MAPLIKHLNFSHVFTPEVRRAAMGAPSKHVVSKGRGPGSLEDEDTAGLDYNIATGDSMPQEVLDAVDKAVEWISRRINNVRLDDDPRARVNVNTLGVGQRYEKHLDGNPITLLVFLNNDFKGGTLIADGVAYPAMPGHAVLFEGWCIPHEVTEVTQGTRATMPINLYPVGWEVEGYEGRDAETNTHLYGEQ